MSTYRYTYHGLTIDSDYHLPELGNTGVSTNVDVTIKKTNELEIKGTLKSRQRLIEINPSSHLFYVDGIALFSINSGKEINIKEYNTATLFDIRLYLISNVWNILLNQREKFLIHASSVRINNETILITGPSLFAKSILGQELKKRGAQLISDHFSCIEIIDDKPYVYNGIVNKPCPHDEKINDISNLNLQKCHVLAKIIHLQTFEMKEFKAEQIKGVNKVYTLLGSIFNNEINEKMHIEKLKYFSKISESCNFTSIKMPYINFDINKLINIIN